MNLMQVCKAPLSEGTEQVQCRGALIAISNYAVLTLRAARPT